MKTQNRVTLVWVAIVSLVVSQTAMAQGVGNLSSLPTQFETSIPPSSGWVVVEPTGLPVPVSLDPKGPVWRKNFTGPNGGPFVYPALSPPLTVSEHLVVAGNLPWTDWHEDVLDPNWTWANPVLLVNGLPAPGLTVPGVGTSSLSFFFNPVAPGSFIDISKELVYNGVPGTAFTGTLPIIQYPTPEPATLGLVALGSLLLVRRRRMT
jgi:hypothetical protein